MQGQEKNFRGSCHCGAVTFELISDMNPALRCNCSLCKRKGAAMVTAKNGSFRITGGEDNLSVYQFHTRAAKHFFCKTCGIYTFHNPRSNPALTRVNAGCLEGVDPLTLDTELVNGAALP